MLPVAFLMRLAICPYWSDMAMTACTDRAVITTPISLVSDDSADVDFDASVASCRAAFAVCVICSSVPLAAFSVRPKTDVSRSSQVFAFDDSASSFEVSASTS